MRSRSIRRIALAVLSVSGACTGAISGEVVGPSGPVADQPRAPAAQAPAPPPPPGATSACTGLQAFAPGVRRLTRREYENSVRSLLGEAGAAAGFALDEKVAGFDANARSPIAELQVEQLMEAAERLAARAATRLPALLGCDAAQEACVRGFVSSFGRRAFRRPLTAGEVEGYLRLATAAGGRAAGVEAVLTAMLQSPHLLYRAEVGTPLPGQPGVLALSSHALASRLAFTLWAGPPDETLLAAADAGALATPDGLAAQARRMLAVAAAGEVMSSFHGQLLGIDHLDNLDKDTKYFPEWNATLAKSMRAETERFVSELGRDRTTTLDGLLTAPFTFADSSLAKLYGARSGDASMRIELDPQQRAGLLTHAGVLAAHAKANQTSPVLRGRLVREQLFCQPPPPPPPDVNNTVPEPDPRLPTRERFAQHRENPSCAGCHALMDPIGFGFEAYDGIGRWRTSDAGRPVDARGELHATDVDGPFEGARALAGRLTKSRLVSGCYTTQWARYSFAQDDTRAAACALDAIGVRFADTRNLHDLLVAMVTSDAFRFQRAP